MISQNQAFRQFLKRREDALVAQEQTRPAKNDLFNEKTFYKALIGDMLSAKKEVIIYSPYVSKFRTDILKLTIEKLIDRNIAVFVFTRPLDEYEPMIRPQIECALKRFEELGVSIFYHGRYIHQKVAIIDREILWEGSLNILSHRASNELMRRIPDTDAAMQVMSFLEINQSVAESYKHKYEKMYGNLIKKSKKASLQRIKIFCTGFALPFLLWWLFLAFRIMIISLKTVKFIVNLLTI
jgi:phosphatidylserine/phosphatidylglycerophosphate/cardiolipin synthase-like enzyme